MEIKEIAVKYGVPFRETCAELGYDFDGSKAFKNKTLFYWIGDNLCYFDSGNKKFKCIVSGVIIEDWVNFIHAPQVHEIAPLVENAALSVYITKMVNYKYDFSKRGIPKVTHCVSFENWDCENIYIDIVNNHYAQAYAELYLRLKAENLLNI